MGNDLIPHNLRNVWVKVPICKCKEYVEFVKAQEKMEFNTGLDKTDYHPGCQCFKYEAHSTYLNEKYKYPESEENKLARDGVEGEIETKRYNVGRVFA